MFVNAGLFSMLVTSCFSPLEGRMIKGKGALQVDVTKESSCREINKAEQGDKITVHYGGFLQDGRQNKFKNQLLNTGIDMKKCQGFPFYYEINLLTCGFESFQISNQSPLLITLLPVLHKRSLVLNGSNLLEHSLY